MINRNNSTFLKVMQTFCWNWSRWMNMRYFFLCMFLVLRSYVALLIISNDSLKILKLQHHF